MKKLKRRYRVIRKVNLDGDLRWTYVDKEYPWIGHELYSTKAEAQAAMCGEYAMTPEEYAKWKG